nr:hypothetical protein [Tanacetum cinerariifolium]
MPKERKLLDIFEKIGLAIMDLRDRIDVTFLEDRKRRWMSDSKNSFREFYKTDVILMSVSLSKTMKELQQELIEEVVQEILNIFESMEQKVEEKSPKENISQNEIDRLLKVSLTREIRDPSYNCSNFQDSSKDSQSTPSKINLDNLFGPLYEEYYATSTLEVSNNSTSNTLDNEDTPSSSSIVVEEDEAPQIVSSSAEPVATEPNTPVSNENVN